MPKIEDIIIEKLNALLFLTLFSFVCVCMITFEFKS